MNRSVALGLLLATGVALVLRVPELNRRPMHNDEAVNAVKFGQLWEHGSYRYDPNEHHGPTLYYATSALAWLTRAPDFNHISETRLRLVPVLFGAGLLLLFPLIADGLGRRATIWAGLFTAVSPAMVYYSRDYIHESLLVFFSFLSIVAGWRYWRKPRLLWAVLAGAGLGLMDATKETFVFSIAAMAFALAGNEIWRRWIAARQGNTPRVLPRPGHVAAGLFVWLVMAVVLFTSFFTNASGPMDSIRTYLPWLARAEGASPHVHPAWFYLHRLVWFHAAKGPSWTEALILFLAIPGAAAGFRRRLLADADSGFIRFLTFYSVALWVIYGVIPYKTPWCLLNFWQVTLLLAGAGAVALVESVRLRWARLAIVFCLIAGAADLGWQAWRAGTSYAASPDNPYVYAQTSPDILRLVKTVNEVAGAAPREDALVLKIMAPESDYWPLPWYLRRFSKTGWWDEVPADPYGSMMIVSSKFNAALDARKSHLMVGYFELRPQNFFELYIRTNVWQAYLDQRARVSNNVAKPH